MLIFDLDGTLIDSRLDLVHSVNATLRHMKRPELPDEVIASYVGDGAPALIGRALGSEARDEKLVRSGLEYFLAYYREHKLDHTHLYEGIKEALATLRNSHNGLPRKMAVLSNKPVNPSRAIVEALGLASFLSVVYGGNSFPTKKPDPEGAQTILREIGARTAGNPDRRRLRGGCPYRPQCRDMDLRRDLRLRPAHLREPARTWCSTSRLSWQELFAESPAFLTSGPRCPQCPPWLTLFCAFIG